MRNSDTTFAFPCLLLCCNLDAYSSSDQPMSCVTTSSDIKLVEWMQFRSCGFEPMAALLQMIIPFLLDILQLLLPFLFVLVALTLYLAIAFAVLCFVDPTSSCNRRLHTCLPHSQVCAAPPASSRHSRASLTVSHISCSSDCEIHCTLSSPPPDKDESEECPTFAETPCLCFPCNNDGMLV